MITFPHIGFMGRLGNQMFQYAALVSISKKYKSDFYLPRINIQLYECFNLKTKVYSQYNSEFDIPHGLPGDIASNGYNIVIQNEEQNGRFLNTAFDKDYFESNHNNKSILGFFQNYNYFIDNESSLRKEYVFKNIYNQISNTYLRQRFFGSEIISLHIRRTDYINSHVLNSLDINYYDVALSYFDKSLPVLVFSDDIEWCKSQKIFDDDRFFMMESNNTYIDLCLMSKCNYHIIANSSFSWWGSWLAQSKKTICPKQWFLPYCDFLDSDGLRLPHWISV